jgi:hypothetical protein
MLHPADHGGLMPAVSARFAAPCGLTSFRGRELASLGHLLKIAAGLN